MQTHLMPTVADTNTTEVEFGIFAAYASDLGLKAGQWPEFLPTNLGNGMRFQRYTKKMDSEGDIMWVTYTQVAGCLRLRVYND